MKYIKEFNFWFEQANMIHKHQKYGTSLSPSQVLCSKSAWQTCEDFLLSRTCAGCKHLCEESQNWCVLFQFTLPDDCTFSCNKWESKGGEG
jgi:hypothetical protein